MKKQLPEKQQKECKCGYVWMSRVENPKACPNCKSRLKTTTK